MSNSLEYDDDQFDPNEPDWVRQLRKQVREQAKELKTLREENQKLSTASRQASLTELLKAKGADPRAVRFYPSDLEVDEVSLDKWLQGDGDVFAPKAPESTQEAQTPAASQSTTSTQAPPSGDAQTPPELPAWAQSFQAIGQTEQAGDAGTPNVNDTKAADLFAAAARAKNSQEFLQYLQSGGTAA